MGFILGLRKVGGDFLRSGFREGGLGFVSMRGWARVCRGREGAKKNLSPGPF
jgi:hypothetical protein